MSRKGYGGRIAEREAHVVGQAPRVAALEDREMTAEMRAVVDDVRAAAGAGKATIVPEYMRTVVKHPGLFRMQMELGAVLFRGKIPARERELAILRIGWLAGAPYEWGEHVRISKRYGVTPEEIERCTEGSAAKGWSEHDAAILRGVEELLADFALTDATWNVLARTWDEQQLIEFPSMVGAYIVSAYVQNSLRIRLAEDNTGLNRR